MLHLDVLLRNLQLQTVIWYMYLYWIYVFLQIGFILNLKLFKTTPVSKYFEDQFYWEVSCNVKLTVWEYI